MIVYLLGFMGSGKSTIGKKVASKLGWTFSDLDQLIAKEICIAIPQIFKGSGEEVFRKHEADALRSLSASSNMVVSCGGGTPCFHDNIAYMNKTGITVYLKMTAAALESRLRLNKSSRPIITELADDELLSYIEESLTTREKWYSQAKIEIEGLNIDITQLCEILRAQ